MHETVANLWLKKGEDKRLRAGHPWIFSNEIDTAKSPLRDISPGQPVIIRDSGDRIIGGAYANPHSLICARLVSRHSEQTLSASLITHRLNIALSLRQRLYARPFYRLVYGETDGLPGLVVDRFGSLCVVQINTAGMEAARDDIISALRKTVAPEHIMIRADSAMRELEGLPRYVEWVEGDGPDEMPVEENGCQFVAPTTSGQKTGWYFDHRSNRARLAPYVRGSRVLDVFSYVGAWGVQAAAAGAAEVTCVDSSVQALEYVARNASLNGVDDRVHTRAGDAFEVLKGLREVRERYDVVIIDPPAFIKRRKDVKAGLKAYYQLNQLAIQVLAKDGLLVSASCSSHLTEAELNTVVLGSARHLDRSAQIVETGHQGPDHPVHPAIPETRYLKALFARILPAANVP